MQRSLVELEHEGLLFSNRTSNRFVTKDKALMMKVKEEHAFKITTKLTQRLLALGLKSWEIVALVNRVFEKGEENETDCNDRKSQ